MKKLLILLWVSIALLSAEDCKMPLSFNQFVQLATGLANKDRVKTLYRACGVAFPVNDANIHKLRASGVSAEFIDMLRGVAQPRAATPRRPARNLKLAAATDAYNRGDYQGAIDKTTAVVEAQTGDELREFYELRCKAFLELADYKQAEAECTKAIAHGADDGWAYYYRGSARSEAGRRQDAIDDFNEALKRQPRNLYALSYRGGIFNILKDYESARRDLDEAVRGGDCFGAKPDDSCGRALANRAFLNLRVNGGRGKDNQGLQEAVRDLERAVAIDPTYGEALQNLGWAYYETGQDEKSLEALNKAIKSLPARLRAHPYYQRSFVFERMHRVPEAVADCKAAQELDRIRGEKPQTCLSR